MKHNYINTLLKYDSAWKGHGLFAMKLVEILNPKIVVDLGVDYGFSTFCLGYPCIGNVYGVDWFQGDIHAGYRNTYPMVLEMYDFIKTEFGVNNIEFIKGDFNEVAESWDNPIDILHIDGLHTYEAVKRDFTNWSKFCTNESVILFHDIESYPDTVGVFFSELNGYKLIHSGSAGLGILTNSVETYNNIVNII